MARLRILFLYIFVVAATVVLSMQMIWHLTPVKDDIRKTLILKLRPYLGEDFLLHDFSLGLGYISFQQVTTGSINQSYRVDLEEVRIGYDIVKLLRYEFEPLKVINSVTLKNPRVILYQVPGERKLTAKVDSSSTDQVIQKVLLDIQQIPNINRILVSDAEVYWETSDGKRIQVFDELKGYLVSREEGIIDLDLLGNFYGSSKSSIDLKGVIDLSNETVNAGLNLNDCRLSPKFPFLKNSIYSLKSAQLDGKIDLFASAFQLEKLQLFGTVTVSELNGHIYNQPLQAESFDLHFSGLNISFRNIRGKLADGNFSFKGSIDNLLNPHFDWDLKINGFSAKYLKRTHNVFEYVLDGKLSGQGRFYGPPDSIQITAKVQAPGILYAVVPFKDIEAELDYSQKILRIPALSVNFKDFHTTGEGMINFNDSLLNFALVSDITIPDKKFQIVDRLNKSEFLMDTDFGGNFITKKFNGKFEYLIRQQDDVLFRGEGPFALDDQYLTFFSQSKDLRDTLTVSGEVRELFRNPTFLTLTAHQFPLKECATNSLVRDFAETHVVNLRFGGPYDLLMSRLNIFSRTDGKETFSMQGNINEIFSNLQSFSGEFEANTAPLKAKGKVELSLGQKGIQVKLNIAKLLIGNLTVDFKGDVPINGKLYVKRFSVPDYLANNKTLAGSLTEGFVQGEMDISGSLKNPILGFNLSAEEFIINNVGYYSTRVTGLLKEQRLSFDNFWVRLNDTPVFNADFQWDISKDTLELEITGDNIESNFLAETIFRDKSLIRGYFSYNITAKGSSKRPEINGFVKIHDGVLKDNPFEVLTIAFNDSIPGDAEVTDIDQHLIRINDFEYIDRKNFSVEGKGLLGLAADGLLDLSVNVSGNILAELPRIQPFFKNIQSVGELSVKIEGNRSAPLFTEADLKIFDGSMEFESVIPPLKNLRAEIQLAKNSQFVNIKKIEGTLVDRPVKIYNLEEVKIGSNNLSPWIFEDIGLNFGVLVLETDERGIPLSIPGLMEEGDIGYFAVEGKREEEKFYFSGPPEKPFVRGNIVLYNSRVTFPFIGMEEEAGEGPGNPVVEFLKNTEWDVLALSGGGNRYFVEIPAYFGEAYMDLDIDNDSEGLEFSGKWNDESFRVEGGVSSSRGSVEYLDNNFRVQKFGAEFSRFELYPTVYGKAYTTVRDSSGQFPRDIYLVLYAIDPETNQEISRGRWEDFRFKLVSSDPVEGETQEQVLAYMGYSVKNIPGKAGEVGLTMTENLLMRPIVRPIERRIERGLGLDYVRFRSRFTSNLLYMSMRDRFTFLNSPLELGANLNNNLNPALLLFQSSELTLGKYLTRDLYFNYTGQLLSGYEESNFDKPRLGFYHRFGVEYRVLRNLLLEIEYDNFQLKTYYYNRADLNDFRIRLRHSFHF